MIYGRPHDGSNRLQGRNTELPDHVAFGLLPQAMGCFDNGVVHQDHLANFELPEVLVLKLRSNTRNSKGTTARKL